MSAPWTPQHDLSTSKKPALTRRAYTLAEHGPDGFHTMLDPANRKALFGTIDVKNAKCSKEEDKDMILAEVGFGKQRAPTGRTSNIPDISDRGLPPAWPRCSRPMHPLSALMTCSSCS